MIARRTLELLRSAHRGWRGTQLTLQSASLSEIYAWAPRLADKMRQLPGFVDVNTDMQISAPQSMVDMDRDRAQALGLTPQQIQEALFSAYGTREVSVIYLYLERMQEWMRKDRTAAPDAVRAVPQT